MIHPWGRFHSDNYGLLYHPTRRNALKEIRSYTGTGVAGPVRSSFYMPSLPDALSWPSISRIGAKRGTPSTVVDSKPPIDSDDHHSEANKALNLHPSQQADDLDLKQSTRRKGVRKVKVTMYNFGSPRVGNGFFAHFYNRIVPDSFRTVVDGDLVTSLPPTGYRHVGTQAVVDNLGAGSIIIDPSFIERRLRTHTKSSVSVHSLLVYRKVSHPLFVLCVWAFRHIFDLPR